eukprot:6969661-Ditylum_brightwellii.AAC.1
MQRLFFDSRYAEPQLLGIVWMEWNLLVVVICRANRKGFPSDDLELNKNEQCREFVYKIDPRLGMVVTR